MVVYVEAVLIDNFAITYLLARLTYYVLGERPRWWRIVSAAVLGAITAVLSPLINSTLWAILYKVLCFLALSAILFIPKKSVKGPLFFLLFTFAFGGCVFAVAYFVLGSVERALTEPLLSFPIGAVLLLCYLLFLLLRFTVRRTMKQNAIRNFIYEAKITVFGKPIECKAFLDSGNRLCDNVSGLPIVVTSMSTLSKALDCEKTAQLLSGKIHAFRDAHYVDFGSLGGDSRMLVFMPDEIVVYREDKKNIIKEVMLGVSFKKISDVEKYGLILNPAAMVGE